MKSIKTITTALISACIIMNTAVCPMQARAEEAAAGNITVTKTGLSAYSIGMEGEGNYEGYGSFILDNEQDGIQNVLIDRSGNILFSNFSTEEEEMGYHYQVHGGVVSEGLGTYLYIISWLYFCENEPAYYNLNGSRLFDKVTVPAGTVLVQSGLKDPFEAGLTMAEQDYRIRLAKNIQENPFMLTCRSTPMAGGYAVAELVSGGGPVFIDQTGVVTHVLNSPEDYDSEKGIWRNYNYAGWFGDNGWVACFIDEQMIGYKDGHGQWMLKTSDFAPNGLINSAPFRNGLSAVQSSDEKWGIIDTNGTFVIPCIYDELSLGSGDDRLIAACLNGKWGFIDENNATVIPFVYSFTNAWGNGAGVVRTENKYGMVDRNNNLILPCEYDVLTGFVNGVAYGIKHADIPDNPGEVYIITINATP